VGHGQSPTSSEVRRVVWADEAVANLESIAAYINDFSHLAAQRLALRLKSAADSLADQAERGRTTGRRARELTVIYPYIIRYMIDDTTVRILRIRHGARRPS